MERKKILNRLQKIAFGKSNDAVKLAFLNLDEDNAKTLDELDLTLLSEVKRGGNGAIELKFLNRLEILEMLLSQLENEANAQGEAETQEKSGLTRLYEAVERAAEQTGDTRD